MMDTVSPATPTGGTAARNARTIADTATGMTLADVPDRELTQPELLALAASIAEQPELWRDRVAFDDDDRHYVCLYRDAAVDVWLLCWTPSNDTGWHDHDVSAGAVAVVSGRLVEHALAIGAGGVPTEVPADRVFSFGPDHIHRLTGHAAETVSVHAYSPPLWRMGQYSVDAVGVLHRLSVSYADELRPLDDVPADGGVA
jgi:predicted metal-dependent enzyme (double-stranded beta helix superfamily)